jgi:hypothetical protein
MLLILTRFIRPFGLEYESGATVLYFGWTVWMMALSYLLPKKLRERERNKITNT